MLWKVGHVIWAGTLIVMVGCAGTPPEPDLLLQSQSSPAKLPPGAVKLGESEAVREAAIQPEISGSVISWSHPQSGMRIRLFLGDEKSDPQEGNTSRVEIVCSESSESHLVVPSLVTKALYQSRGVEVIPRVTFSPGGQTALFEENTTDASPVYNNVLFAADPVSGELETRVLKLPHKPVLPYGVLATVLSITDDEATMAFFPDKLYFRIAFDKLEDAERQVN